jgi:outer membrane biosynthesis protein TonB
MKYLNKHMFFPAQYNITNADEAVVVVDANIDEDGHMTDAEVSTPFYPDFDKIARQAVQKSPDWIPARMHNRHVKFFIRQPVVFSQPE